MPEIMRRLLSFGSSGLRSVGIGAAGTSGVRCMGDLRSSGRVVGVSDVLCAQLVSEGAINRWGGRCKLGGTESSQESECTSNSAAGISEAVCTMSILGAIGGSRGRRMSSDDTGSTRGIDICDEVSYPDSRPISVS